MHLEASTTRPSIQTSESYEEQSIVFDAADRALSHYLSASGSQTKSISIIGAPGCGKTVCLLITLLKALCKGLNVGMTALLSERARELGGIHLHQMFLIPVAEATTNVVRLAERAAMELYRNPKKLAMIQTLDVLFIDELGPIPAELVAVIDIIARRVRSNHIFMGGILLFSTMDGFQLKPIQGRPPLLSAHMLTSFNLFKLEESVRAALDGELKKIQKITRVLPTDVTDEITSNFRALLSDNCVFCDSWDDPQITDNALRIFGKKAAGREAEKKLLLRMKQTHAETAIFCNCEDEESSLEGN